MNRFLKFVLNLGLIALPVSLAAQTAMIQTTLSGAVVLNQTQIQVASATGIYAPSPLGGQAQTAGSNTFLVVDNEVMSVSNVSGTLVSVVRGVAGSKAKAHNASAVVWVGAPSVFLTDRPTNTCTPSTTYTPSVAFPQAYSTYVTYWNCVTISGTNSVWVPTLTTGSITPAASSAAVQTAAQTFTVAGLVTGEPLVVISQPAPTSLCPLVAARTTAANTVSLYFSTLTAAACTPAAGTYLVAPVRFEP